MWGGVVAPGRGAVKVGRRPAERSLDGSAGSARHYSTMAVAGRPTAGLEALGWDVTGVRHPANGLCEAAGRFPDGANHNQPIWMRVTVRFIVFGLVGKMPFPPAEAAAQPPAEARAGLKK